MKVRESGMPEQAVWESFFDEEEILTRLQLSPDCANVVEFGCGYGTFTLPAARRISGTVFALDIDPTMLKIAERRAASQQIVNIKFLQRDFITEGTGLDDGIADYAMLFNILHCPDPVALLREAYRNLCDGGSVAIVHWVHDPDTPRGPPIDIRPRPEQCRKWARQAGFAPRGGLIDLPPYHYGMTLRRG